MNTPSYDVAILGGGPVGCVLALALARHAPNPQRILLAGPRPAQRAPDQILDPRALALNHGSRRFLESLDAWPRQSADITQVHVSQVGHAGRTQISHTDLEVPRLGSVVTYDTLLETLHQALDKTGISRLEDRPQRPLAGQPVQLPMAHQTLTAHLALLSDGKPPHGLQRQYHQEAVLATVRASRPSPGLAFERFTREGPLALLPHPAQPDLYSLVWCVAPDHARVLRSLDEATFNQALQNAFGQRLGTVQRLGATYGFPLSMHLGPQALGPGIVAVGNAAQTLHPVAGQGLNLGLRDVAQLVHEIEPWLARPSSDTTALVARYTHKRALDRLLTAGITDTLPRLFATDFALQRHLGGLGLAVLDLVSGLRRPFARHLLQGQRR